MATYIKITLLMHLLANLFITTLAMRHTLHYPLATAATLQEVKLIKHQM